MPTTTLVEIQRNAQFERETSVRRLALSVAGADYAAADAESPVETSFRLTPRPDATAPSLRHIPRDADVAPSLRLTPRDEVAVPSLRLTPRDEASPAKVISPKSLARKPAAGSDFDATLGTTGATSPR